MAKKLSVFVLLVITGSLFFFIGYTDFLNTDTEEEEKGPDQRPAEWAWMQRTYPYMEADPLAHYEAAKEASAMRLNSPLKSSAAGEIPEWEMTGPVNIGGRMVDIAFNPVNPDTVYSAASTGGVFKSDDKGVTWYPVFDEQAVLPMGDIAVNPDKPWVVYAGTGEPNGSHNNFPGAGIFKSTDAGKTWKNIGLELTAHTGRIVIDPANTEKVFVAAVGSNFGTGPNRGIYRTTDGGDNWEKVLFVSDSTGGIDIVIDPENSDRLMAAMWERVRRPGLGQSTSSFGPTGGIFRSTDGGDTWEKLGQDNNLPPDNSGIGRIGLDIHNYGGLNMVAAVYNDGGTYTGTYYTTDFGDTWKDMDSDSEVSNGVSTFSWYFGQVRIHPQDPNIAYVLDVYLMKTSNGGASWQRGAESYVHVDQHAMEFAPDDPDYILLGNDGGIYFSTNGGDSWNGPSEMPVTQFYEINIDFQNPERLYGGTQDNNTIRTSTGAVDDWERLLGGDGFYVNVDYNDPNIIYAESQYGNLYKSTDGGSNFMWAQNGISSSEPTNWSTPVVMDPNDSKVLYYGSNRVYKTENGADSWSPFSPVLAPYDPDFPSLGTVTTIAPALGDPDVVYAGTDNSKVWVTKDGGENWSEISEGLPNRWVTRVVPDHGNASVVYVTFSGLKWRDPQPHVFKSTDMGNSWQDISANLPDAPVNALAVDYNYSERLYAGTDVGAFVSFNGGAYWQPLGTGMPVVSVYDLKIHPSENYIAAGTHGRSMYKLDLHKLTAIENGALPPEEFVLEQNYPNPFNPSTTIRYTTGSEGFVSLKVYNTLGEEVAKLAEGNKAAGSYSAVWNGTDKSGSSVSSGVYIYSLEAGGKTISKKMTLVK